MSVQSDAIKAVLAADATLMATLTGGLWKFSKSADADTDSIGRNGISSVSMPTAYDGNGLLMPLAIVAARSENPFGGGYSHVAQYKTVRDMVEIYFYCDGDKGATALNAAADRVEHLLQGQFVGAAGGAGGGWCDIVNRLDEDRDNQVNNAVYLRLDVAMMRGKYA